jgi:hypothetical protein
LFTKCLLFVLFVFPASANYQLNEWTIGAGGTERSASANYQTEALFDPTLGEQADSQNYRKSAPVSFLSRWPTSPLPPKSEHDGDWYNRLLVILIMAKTPLMLSLPWPFPLTISSPPITSRPTIPSAPP